jgi:two-component system chemotaxis response regulator CheY
MGKNVLLCDDAQVIRVMLSRILQEDGYTIVGEAANGQQAVAMYRQLRPDLVFMDITMPEMNGIAAVKEICKEDPRAKIIMCSAMGQKTHVLEAVEAGAKNFVIKPFESKKILDVARAVLG